MKSILEDMALVDAAVAKDATYEDAARVLAASEATWVVLEDEQRDAFGAAG